MARSPELLRGVALHGRKWRRSCGSLVAARPAAHLQCQALIDSLKGTQLWFSCAHGRPTSAALVDLAALDRLLLRTRRAADSSAAERASLAGLRSKLQLALMM